MIKAGINKALNTPQIRNVKKKEKKKILPFISTFRPYNPKALPIIRQALERSDKKRIKKRPNLLTPSEKHQT